MLKGRATMLVASMFVGEGEAKVASKAGKGEEVLKIATKVEKEAEALKIASKVEKEAEVLKDVNKGRNIRIETEYEKLKARIYANIEESRKAREASRYSKFLKKEKAIIEQIETKARVNANVIEIRKGTKVSRYQEFIKEEKKIIDNLRKTEGVSNPNRIQPSLEKGGNPKGNYARGKERGLKKQNETANLLADEGYDITMLDEINGGNGHGIKITSNPDYIIENEVFDCYSPNPDTSIDNITRNITKKTKTQAERIVLNLDDYPAEEIQKIYDAILRKTNENGDLKNLKELLVVRDGKIIRLFVR